MALAIFLFVAGLVALYWKSERRGVVPVPIKETTTLKPWVAVVLILLGLACLGSSCSQGTKPEGTKQEEKSQTPFEWQIKNR
jgi:hypothetical protein